MKKLLGIAGLLFVICTITALCTDAFLTGFNIENLLRRTALFSIISIGAAFVIMTGGIDLSIGSVVCLVGCLTPWLLVEHNWPVIVVVPAVILLGSAIGAFHGLLVTQLRLQPFIVTLCGRPLYRGIARGVTADQTQGFRGGFETLRALGNGRVSLFGADGFGLPAPAILLLVVLVVAVILLNRSVWGRHVLAVGNNETAVRYSGVRTDWVVLRAYMLCGTLSGLGGLLFVLDVGSAQPVDFGNFYELYAIAAAVLGGCSLRGGEGTVIGVVIGAAVMQVLRNSITLIAAIPDNVEYAVIGAVILFGGVADEVLKRLAARRKLEEMSS